MVPEAITASTVSTMVETPAKINVNLVWFVSTSFRKNSIRYIRAKTNIIVFGVIPIDSETGEGHNPQ